MTFRVLGPYLDAGLIPNFKKVIEGGASGVLRSTIPPVTPPGWISLSTGKNIGKHGVYEFSKRTGYKTELVTKNTSPSAVPIWEILGRQGKKVVVINVPMTYPPDAVNGVIISGMMTPNTGTDFTYPKDVKEEVMRLAPGYRIDLDEKTVLLSSDPGRLINEVHSITEDVRKLMLAFLKREWDFFFVVFTGPDRLQHFLWDEIVSMQPACVNYYRLLDGILGDLLATLDGDTVLFVASDHGFMEAKKGFHINNFFMEEGLLHVRNTLKIKNTMSRIHLTSHSIQRLLNNIGLLRLRDSLPPWFRKLIKRFFTSLGAPVDDIDWSRTKAFSLLKYGIVSLNLKGREPDGIVEPNEYDDYCEIIRKRLMSFKDPLTGKGAIKSVHKCDELFPSWKSYDIYRPDMLVEAEEGYSINVEFSDNVVSRHTLVNRSVTADHHADGVFIAYGGPIRTKSMQADICDIMPTILYLAGVPVPEDVDGRVLTDIIDGGYLERNKVVFDRASGTGAEKEKQRLNDDEKEELKKRLKSLGYME